MWGGLYSVAAHVTHTGLPPLACCDVPPPERRNSPDKELPARWPSRRLNRDAESLSEEEIEHSRCQFNHTELPQRCSHYCDLSGL